MLFFVACEILGTLKMKKVIVVVEYFLFFIQRRKVNGGLQFVM